jgi:hypothetical protein
VLTAKSASAKHMICQLQYLALVIREYILAEIVVFTTERPTKNFAEVEKTEG